MEPLKRYTQNVAESFHISQASIDITSVAQETNPTQLILEFESNDFLLATLSKNAKIYQVPLDLNFQKGDHVSFRTVGPGIIHLSGKHGRMLLSTTLVPLRDQKKDPPVASALLKAMAQAEKSLAHPLH